MGLLRPVRRAAGYHGLAVRYDEEHHASRAGPSARARGGLCSVQPAPRPRTALRRWQQNIQSKYGSNALHLHTDFYDLTLAQTLQENGEVLDAGYSTITELRETEHLFLLHCGRQQWYFVNKAGFTKGTPDEFRTFISERIGG